jgi:uncharacterized membrane protein YdjX (TVP38/TMEM64 family)
VFEIIGLIIGAAVAFFCYRQGLKDGQRVKENKPIEKILPKSEAKKEERKASTVSQYLGANGDGK